MLTGERAGNAIATGTILAQSRRMVHSTGTFPPAVYRRVCHGAVLAALCGVTPSCRVGATPEAARPAATVTATATALRAVPGRDLFILPNPHNALSSVVTFDAWTAMRAERLNDKVERRTGRRLFGDAPLGDGAPAMAAALRRKGYGGVKVTPLDEIARQYGVDAIADPMQNSWLVAEAQLAERGALIRP